MLDLKIGIGNIHYNIYTPVSDLKRVVLHCFLVNCLLSPDHDFQ